MTHGLMSDGGFTITALGPIQSWDPSQYGSTVRPVRPIHGRFQYSTVYSSSGVVTNGLMTSGTVVNASGSFDVLDNNFSDRVDILIGDFVLTCFVDFQPGMNEDETAANIAAAISKLPTFVATSDEETVLVQSERTADDVCLRVVNHGSTEFVGNVTPGNGLFLHGTPSVGPPVRT